MTLGQLAVAVAIVLGPILASMTLTRLLSDWAARADRKDRLPPV